MPEEKTGSDITFAGVKIGSAPKWAIGIAVIAGVAVWGYSMVARPELAALTAEQARANLQASIDEFGRHYAEQPESSATLLDDARGKLVVSRYADGCLLIARSAPAKAGRTKLVVDLLSKDPDGVPHAHNLIQSLVEPVEARGQCYAPLQHPCTQRPNGACFDSWYGQRQGCMIEVWRRWSDGCQQSQWLDTCHGSFVGIPRWSNCVH